MKKTIIGALAFAMLSTSSFAAFVNGSFETGDMSGWSYRWGTTKSYGTVGKWATPGLWEKDVTWSGATNWPGVTDFGNAASLKAAVVTKAEGENVYLPVYSTPFDLTRHLVMNAKPNASHVNLDGSYDVTEFAQKTIVSAEDIGDDGKYHLYFGWAAFIENPGDHETENQPGFLVMLGVKPAGATAWTYTQEFHSGDQQTQNGWTKTPVDRGVATYAKRTSYKKEVQLGDSVSIQVAVIDCGYGAHGALAFIDQAGFKIVDTTDIDSGVVAAPCIYGSDSLLFGSRVKARGDFGSGKGILFEADAVDSGNGWAVGNVYMRDRSGIVGNLVRKGNLVPWNNTRITGSNTQKNITIPALRTKSFQTGTNNAYAYWGNVLTLTPGDYGDVYGYGGSIKLTAGTYNFRSFTMYQGGGALILDNSNGPIMINVAGTFEKHDVKDSIIVSDADYVNSGVYYYIAGDLKIFSGVNHVWGSFDVPNGTATLDSREIGGYVHAKRVVINSDAKSTCREALPLRR